MNQLTGLVSLCLSSLGLTVLLVWPERGPSAWVRDSVLRRILPQAVRPVLDCYVCAGFWSGLLLSPLWWSFYHELWCWTACLMAPALFWLVVRNMVNYSGKDDNGSDTSA